MWCFYYPAAFILKDESTFRMSECGKLTCFGWFSGDFPLATFHRKMYLNFISPKEAKVKAKLSST